MKTIRQKANILVESAAFQYTVLLVILFNALMLGVETTTRFSLSERSFLGLLDDICIVFFILEVIIKFIAKGRGFFKNGWYILDLLVVLAAILPISRELSILRTLRVFRALKVISSLKALRMTVGALVKALPGVASAVILLVIVFYISSILTTNLFGAKFPEMFGTLSNSVWTLIQVMTFDSWSSGVAKPVIEVYPFAWLFFIPFIIFSSLTILNVFIAIVVEAMIDVKEEEEHVEEKEILEHQELISLLEEINTRLKKLESERY